MLASQFLVCCCVYLKMESHLIFLPLRIVGQQLALDGFTRLWQLIRGTWELLELKDCEPINFKCYFYVGNQRKTMFFLKLLPPIELN